MKTNGQIAYEAWCYILDIAPINQTWEQLGSIGHEAWDYAAQAVLAAQWKPASEPPDNDRRVLVLDGFKTMRVDWYMPYKKEWNVTRSAVLWCELPQIPKQE